MSEVPPILPSDILSDFGLKAVKTTGSKARLQKKGLEHLPPLPKDAANTLQGHDVPPVHSGTRSTRMLCGWGCTACFGATTYLPRAHCPGCGYTRGADFWSPPRILHFLATKPPWCSAVLQLSPLAILHPGTKPPCC